MEAVVAVLSVVAVVAAGTWFQYRLSRGRMWTPLWMAFSATATSALFLVAGILGVNLSKHSRFLAGDAVSSEIIWWEVGIGVALAILAAFLWRLGVSSLRHQTSSRG